jgi:hypothetical protein
MNCHDAREGFSALFHGGMGLTEWALLEAHVRQCVECSKGRESVQKVVSSCQQVTPSRARLHDLSKIIDTRILGPLTRAAIEAARAKVMWLITRCAQLQIWLCSSSLIVFKWFGRGVIEGVRAAANGIEATRFASVHFAGLLAWLRVPGRAAVRMIEASRVGVTWLVGVLARMRCVLPLLCRLSERTAVKTIGATWSLLSHKVACSFLRVSTGIASLAILVATMLFLWPVFLWPREWPDNFMPRPSTGDRLSQDVRPPADRKPAEPAVVAPLAETRTPKSVSAPQPAPAAVSQPETRRVAVRPNPAETQAEIPAPLPSPDPALAQSRTAASAPTPTPESTWSREPSRLQESARSQDGVGSQNAEASDPAIDWPLKGGQETSRRSIESP